MTKDFATIDESGLRMGFPHEFFASEMVRTFAFGGLRDRIKG
jgi:hypothetical protein